MFWHGNLDRNQIKSMLSFQEHGFEVILWSFERYILPSGIQNRDANEILPRSLTQDKSYIHWSINSPEGIDTYPKSKSAAVFYSDILRIDLLDQFGGWWFDCDMLCLKDVSWFDEYYNSSNVCGSWQFEDSINNAVLAIPNRDIIKQIKNFINTNLKNASEYSWGHFGPDMITPIVIKNKLKKDIMPEQVFYPFSPENFDYMKPWQKESFEECSNRIKESATIHWFDNLIYNRIPSGTPETGSLMDSLL